MSSVDREPSRVGQASSAPRVELGLYASDDEVQRELSDEMGQKMDQRHKPLQWMIDVIFDPSKSRVFDKYYETAQRVLAQRKQQDF